MHDITSLNVMQGYEKSFNPGTYIKYIVAGKGENKASVQIP